MGLGAAVLLALLGGGLALLVSASGPSRQHRASGTHGHGPALCPLTHEPAPGGVVPQRPALAVKIGNEPEGARPQSGLNEADIVYDTPAEGLVMRYMAVYQCHTAASIGPVRSVRWVDYHILPSFGSPVFAFAGGIDPNLSAVASLSWLKPADLLAGAASAGTRISSRVPPDNLYTATSKLWALYPTDDRPPPAVFQYGGALPSGTQPASGLRIDYSLGTIVDWRWQRACGCYVHGYAASNSDTAPVTTDVDALTGKPVTTTNIVVEIVHFTVGPYIESPGSSGDIESETVGGGSGYVLRGGKAIAVTWSRPRPTSPTVFKDAAGQPVRLAPGRTWVELVLDVVAEEHGELTIIS